MKESGKHDWAPGCLLNPAHTRHVITDDTWLGLLICCLLQCEHKSSKDLCFFTYASGYSLPRYRLWPNLFFIYFTVQLAWEKLMVCMYQSSWIRSQMCSVRPCCSECGPSDSCETVSRTYNRHIDGVFAVSIERICTTYILKIYLKYTKVKSSPAKNNHQQTIMFIIVNVTLTNTPHMLHPI